VNPTVQRLGDLRIDLAAKPGQTSKRCLDVTARTAEAIVEIEMP